MKSIFKIMVLSLCAMAIGEGNNPKMVTVNLTHAFLPYGFDNNDRIQAMVEGVFPNPCHKLTRDYTVKVDETAKKISIEQNAYQYTGFCVALFVPFSQTIDFGIISTAGDYEVMDAQSKAVIGTLNVSEPRNPTSDLGPDDFLYAPVRDAFITKDAAGNPQLVVRSVYADSCTTLDASNILIDYQKEVIVVEPRATKPTTGTGVCEPTLREEEVEKPLVDMPKGTFLLHVRSANGEAINKIVHLK